MSAAIAAARVGDERRLGADDRGQRLAVHVLHDDEVGAVGLAPVKDRDDVRVRQVRGGLGLPAEALDEGVVRRQLREEHLQGDRAVEQQVACEIDLGRPAAGDLAAQLVAAVVDRRLGRGHVPESLFKTAGLPRVPAGPVGAYVIRHSPRQPRATASRRVRPPPPRSRCRRARPGTGRRRRPRPSASGRCRQARSR